jgi:hypothetical protein
MSLGKYEQIYFVRPDSSFPSLFLLFAARWLLVGLAESSGGWQEFSSVERHTLTPLAWSSQSGSSHHSRNTLLTVTKRAQQLCIKIKVMLVDFFERGGCCASWVCYTWASISIYKCWNISVLQMGIEVGNWWMEKSPLPCTCHSPKLVLQSVAEHSVLQVRVLSAYCIWLPVAFFCSQNL